MCFTLSKLYDYGYGIDLKCHSRKTCLHQINVVINTRYLILKFLTQKGVATSQENQTILKQYVPTCLKSKKMLISDYKGSLKEIIKIRTEATKKLKDICLGEINKQSLNWDLP